MEEETLGATVLTFWDEQHIKDVLMENMGQAGLLGPAVSRCVTGAILGQSGPCLFSKAM